MDENGYEAMKKGLHITLDRIKRGEPGLQEEDFDLEKTI